MRLQIPSASWLRESERERGEGRGESDGEGILGGVLRGGCPDGGGESYLLLRPVDEFFIYYSTYC